MMSPEAMESVLPGLLRLERLGLYLACLGVLGLTASALHSCAGTAELTRCVASEPPHLLNLAAGGVASVGLFLSRVAASPVPRVLIAFAMLYCGVMLVGSLCLSYGYSLLMSGFD